MNKTHVIKKLVTSIVVATVLVVSLFGNTAVSQPQQTTTVIVRGETMAAVEDAVDKVNGYVTSQIDIINAVVAEVPENQLAYLRKLSGVVQVTLDRNVMVSGYNDFDIEIADVEFSKAAGINEVWEDGNLGKGVTVALLDTGIDPTFSSLRRKPNQRGNRYLAYYDAIEHKLYKASRLLSSPRDPNGHGTHLAGIIGNSSYESFDNEYRGVAPAVNLVAVRVLGEEGGGSYSDVLTGINWVVKNRHKYNIRVLNISMYAVPVAPYWADPYNLAVMAAWDAGIVVIASAGNTGPAPMSVGVPGNTPYIITVGAFTDHRTPEDLGDDYIPEFSASGPTLDAFVKPDVIAPGAHIISLMKHDAYLRELYPERSINYHYFEMSGTSMSTAVVSGIAALMISDDQRLTPDQVKYRLMQTARPQFAEESGDAAYSIWQQGAGRVWAEDAVSIDTDGEANRGLDINLDLAGEMHYQGWTTFDAETNEFEIIGGGFDSWADGYTTWSGAYINWEDGYTSWAEGPTNWSNGFDSWADGFDSWADGFDSWADGFDSWADGFDSWADGFDSWADTCTVSGDGFDNWANGNQVPWADGFDSWADGFDSWADGFDSWADGFDSWADFVAWIDGFDSWADGFDSWADGFDSWADIYGWDPDSECLQLPAGFDSWADGFDSWADGLEGWSDGLMELTGAFSYWNGGYTSWADGFDSWADGFDSWADGFDSWADLCGVDVEGFDSWADGSSEIVGFDSWADGFDSWADGFDSWADFIAWTDGFDSWADGFDSWADSDGTRPVLCVSWVNGFDSWADGFDSWADGFDSWADAAPNMAGAFSEWDGGYAVWAGGFDSWADGFDSWADYARDPEWARHYFYTTNVPVTKPVGVNIWVEE